MRLFPRKRFIGAAGQPLTWKIECDSLTKDDWLTLAQIAKERFNLKPSRWHSVPKGGYWFATALMEVVVVDHHGDWIIVDDVLTTGATIRRALTEWPKNQTLPVGIVVAFDRRSVLPHNPRQLDGEK